MGSVLSNHSATWSSPIDRLPMDIGAVEVQCHVLPHKDRLSSKEYESVQVRTVGPHSRASTFTATSVCS